MTRLKNLDLDSHYSIEGIISILSQLDSKLNNPEDIVLCGSSSVLLQRVSFRQTMDIDFCTRPSDNIISLVEKYWSDKRLFDLQAIGVIGLLIDYEDRLVPIDLGFKYLRVFCISKRDWIVSKLASPKLDDVLNRSDITLEDLLWVQENMIYYGGVTDIRASNDLNYLIRMFRDRG